MSQSLLTFKQWLNGFVADDLDRIDVAGTVLQLTKFPTPEIVLAEFDLADDEVVLEGVAAAPSAQKASPAKAEPKDYSKGKEK